MNRLVYFVLIVLFSSSIIISQETFTRTTIINTAQYEANGFGGIVGGVDFDNDGKKEIYLCNVNTLDDPPSALIPRMYKFEWNGTAWDSVWATETTIPKQNTWPAFTTGDLDKDGKPEIIWMPVNFLDATINPNPVRVLIYEYPGDGSDNMGVFDGIGGFLPNATTTLTSTTMFEVRPCKAIISDIDSDNVDEIIFADRRGSGGDYHIGIWSVDNVPDDASGFEVWTEEFTGLADVNLTGIGNNWDVTVVNNYAYLFGSDAAGSIFPIKYDQGYSSLTPQPNMIGALNSFKGTQVADLDENGSKEILVGTMFGAQIYLLQPSVDTLIQTLIADYSTLKVGRIQGSAQGDLDADGKLDFVFGCRNNTADLKNTLIRLEYQGGDITDPANYVKSIIDSLDFAGSGGGEWGIISVANYDNDSADEIVYTADYPRGSAPDILDVYYLDINFTDVEKEESGIPNQFYLGQNFPNPFNPSTQIKFGITEAANVDLRVYDILGSEIAVIVNNEYLSAGSYDVKFDASKLASGVYVYKITAGANTVSRKMQLLK